MNFNYGFMALLILDYIGTPLYKMIKMLGYKDKRSFFGGLEDIVPGIICGLVTIAVGLAGLIATICLLV